MFLLLIMVSALLYSSLIEYLVHRFIFHSSYKHDHVKNHHRIFHGRKSYEFDKVNPCDILSSTKDILRNAVIYLVPSLMIFLQNRTLGAIFFLMCFLYNLWEELLHLYFHKRTNLFFVRFSLFKKLKEHHRIHHFNYQTNYGIGSSFWDIIFRTKKY